MNAAFEHASPAMTEETGSAGTSVGSVADMLNASETVQAQMALGETLNAGVQRKENRTGLPDPVKSGVEGLSGMALDHVRVHRNSAAPAQLNALAYTQGSNIHVAPGQEQHLAHEAWHVVQQMQGRVAPTRQLRGVDLNDDDALEREADVMGARAVQRAASNDLELEHEPVQRREGVVQRALGMEVEIKRKVTTPGGQKVDEGDTELLTHQYFKLVTDKTGGYSNLEMVMVHFDQLAGSEQNAIQALDTRLAAMKAMYDRLYAAEGTLGTLVPGIGTGPMDQYTPSPVDYIDKQKRRVRFDPKNAGIATSPIEDNKLYVHFTVGFEPKDWLKMVQDIAAVTRPDTAKNRPKGAATAGLAAADAAYNALAPGLLSADDIAAMKGHLALMYMQMRVFVERTLDLDEKAKTKVLLQKQKKVDDLEQQIADIDADGSLNILQKDAAMEQPRKQLRVAKRVRGAAEVKLAAIQREKPFGKGQPKNKIAALPRATLHEMYGALPQAVQLSLAAGKDTVFDVFANDLEAKFGLDLNEQHSLEFDTGMEATLGEYLESGLGSGTNVSTQVLFGASTHVGIDQSTGRHLVPFEFRTIFAPRLTWAELRAKAVELVKWSRDPQNETLTM